MILFGIVALNHKDCYLKFTKWSYPGIGSTLIFPDALLSGSKLWLTTQKFYIKLSGEFENCFISKNCSFEKLVYSEILVSHQSFLYLKIGLSRKSGLPHTGVFFVGLELERHQDIVVGYSLHILDIIR